MFKELQLGTTEQLIRMALAWAGSALLGAGWAESAEGQSVIGAIMVLGGFVWWLWRNWQTKRALRDITPGR
jgi:hypothetical protein